MHSSLARRCHVGSPAAREAGKVAPALAGTHGDPQKGRVGSPYHNDPQINWGPVWMTNPSQGLVILAASRKSLENGEQE